eukprot:16990-Heterococcus_DN1.PRE.3
MPRCRVSNDSLTPLSDEVMAAICYDALILFASPCAQCFTLFIAANMSQPPFCLCAKSSNGRQLRNHRVQHVSKPSAIASCLYTHKKRHRLNNTVPDQVHVLLGLALRYRKCAQLGQLLGVNALTSAKLKTASQLFDRREGVFTKVLIKLTFLRASLYSSAMATAAVARPKDITSNAEGSSDLAEGEEKGVRTYYQSKIDELDIITRDRTQNLQRLKAQRNELNAKVCLLREELHHLQESGSYVGEVVKAMGKNKVLVK